MTPFDFANAINFTKENLFQDPQADKDYTAFIVNKALSYFSDTILYANQMNIHNDLPKEWQFQFLLNTIPKRKRYSKWNKKESLSKHFGMVKEYYKLSDEKTKQTLDILTDEQLKMIEQKLNKGGK